MGDQAGPRVLFLDIETSPILGYIWELFNNNLSINQIKTDWHLLSWSAKWLNDKKIIYADQRDALDIEDDGDILQGIWKLIDEADVIVTQNGKRFDIKKLNARFLINGLKPPSSYKHIDIYELAKKHFGFTSNRLEYLTNRLCKKNKKSNHKEYPGFELWKACLSKDKRAWKEMEKYNKLDVTSLEELYHRIIPWDNSVNFNLYHDKPEHICKCGSKKFIKNGFAYTSLGKYQRFSCSKCGSEVKSRENLFPRDKRKSLKVKV